MKELALYRRSKNIVEQVRVSGEKVRVSGEKVRVIRRKG